MRATSSMIQFLGSFVKCGPNNAPKLVGGYYHANKYTLVIFKRAINVAYVKADKTQCCCEYHSPKSHVYLLYLEITSMSMNDAANTTRLTAMLIFLMILATDNAAASFLIFRFILRSL